MKPDFFKDEDLAIFPFEVRLFYAGLWGLADKAGRLEDRPIRLKAEIFPYDNIDAEKCLVELNKPKPSSGKPFINRYITDGQRYIQIINWHKHQKPHHTEKDSIIPSCNQKEESSKEETKITEKGMGSLNQLEASTELRNGEITVNERLSTHSQGVIANFSLEDVKNEAILIGVTLEQAEGFYNHYNSQGWKFGSGLLINNLKSALVRWKNNQYKFEKKGGDNKTKLRPIIGKNCHCGLPAVYKSSGGQYDTFYCADHMPEKVKAKFA